MQSSRYPNLQVTKFRSNISWISGQNNNNTITPSVLKMISANTFRWTGPFLATSGSQISMVGSEN